MAMTNKKRLPRSIRKTVLPPILLLSILLTKESLICTSKID